jgi:hypothetical protein
VNEVMELLERLAPQAQGILAGSAFSVVMHPRAAQAYQKALEFRKIRRKVMVSRHQWKFSQGKGR